ncbi:hypothetical protein KC19_10G064100, partial [Ceratodon purpureus]
MGQGLRFLPAFDCAFPSVSLPSSLGGFFGGFLVDFGTFLNWSIDSYTFSFFLCVNGAISCECSVPFCELYVPGNFLLDRCTCVRSSSVFLVCRSRLVRVLWAMIVFFFFFFFF